MDSNFKTWFGSLQTFVKGRFCFNSIYQWLNIFSSELAIIVVYKGHTCEVHSCFLDQPIDPYFLPDFSILYTRTLNKTFFLWFNTSDAEYQSDFSRDSYTLARKKSFFLKFLIKLDAWYQFVVNLCWYTGFVLWCLWS